jgi:hypothetical protein
MLESMLSRVGGLRAIAPMERSLPLLSGLPFRYVDVTQIERELGTDPQTALAIA